VARIVHHVEQHAGGEARREVLDQRAAPGAIAAALRGERGAVGGGGQDVRVAAEHPEALAARGVRRRRMEPHRRVAPQAGEQVVREAVGESTQVGEVDVVERRQRDGDTPGMRIGLASDRGVHACHRIAAAR
jgi:hypothetical protein